MRLKSLSILLALLFGFSPAGFPGTEPSLEVSLDRDTARVGEPIAYTLRVAADPLSRVEFPAYGDGRMGDFEILDSAAATGEDGRWEKRFVLQGFETGEFTLPASEVIVRNEAGGETALAGAALEITITSVLEPESEGADIRDLKDPLGIPYSYLWLLYLTLGAAAAVLGLVFYRRFFRRVRKEPPLPPPRPAAEIAREELERIRREDLPARGLIKEYYSRVSDTVRRYIENRFSLRAPEMTTEEFLHEMPSTGHLTVPQQDLVTAFLQESDLVKFARYGPSGKEIAAVFAAAVRLVEETKESAPVETCSGEDKQG